MLISPSLTCSPERQLGGASAGRSDAARLRRQQANLYVRNLGEMASEHLRALFQVHSWESHQHDFNSPSRMSAL